MQVVLSFVLASAMTTAASILAMILDHAHDSKGQFTLRAPIKYVRERFLDTEWKKDYAWRPFLDPLIIGLGDQQLVTGYAVLLSGWIKVSTRHLQPVYPLLIIYTGRSKHLRSPRRPLCPHSLCLRPFFLIPPCCPHHSTQVLPQIQIHCQNPPYPCHLLRRLPLRIHGCGHLYATDHRVAGRHWHRGTEPGTATFLLGPYAVYSCRFLYSTGMYPVRPAAQRPKIPHFRLEWLSGANRALPDRPNHDTEYLLITHHDDTCACRVTRHLFPLSQPPYRLHGADPSRYPVRDLGTESEIRGAW